MQKNPSGSNSKAIAIWEKKLVYFQEEYAKAASPSLKFELKQQIEECQREILQLGKVKKPPPEPSSNLPYSGVDEDKFFGRGEKLREIHERLRQNNRLAICAVSGMGGIGKTELALQYALSNKDSYPAGLCWLKCRTGDLENQIVSYWCSRLGLVMPENLKPAEQVGYCWENWPEGTTLVIYDDVIDYGAIAPCLPPEDKKRFKILITSRIQPNSVSGIDNISLDVLDENSALDLLRSLVGDDRKLSHQKRIDGEIETARQLCEWLGYLPLGLKLAGSYLAESEDMKLEEIWEELNDEKLEAEALQGMEGELMAPMGIIKAFQLSWQSLSKQAKELGCVLSLFAAADISWELVKGLFVQEGSKKIGKIRGKELLKFSLLQRTDEGVYKLHPLIREFFIAKQREVENIDERKRNLCRVIVAIAKEISEVLTVDAIASVEPKIPHLKELAENLIEWADDQDLIWPYLGLGRFYKGQSHFSEVEKWRKGSVEVTKNRLGENHLYVAASYNNLAELYYLMGKYAEAELSYQKSLNIHLQQLEKNHPAVAASYNNLAGLYEEMGRYAEAEPLYQVSLNIRLKQLGTNHLDVAQSYNNLAGLYEQMGRYVEAESLYQQSLKILLEQLGKEHPDVATSYNNLAGIYHSTGRYVEAESLYQQSLKILLEQLGENHPDVATSYNNLAELYYSMGRCGEAETLCQQALSIRLELLGENHPDVAESYSNLARLYYSMRRYGEAETLCQQALSIRLELLGENHPDVAESYSNLAEVYRAREMYTTAEPLCQQALYIRLGQLGENHPSLAESYNNLAGLYYSIGKYSEALAHGQQAINITRQTLGEGHPTTLTIQNNCARMLMESPEEEILKALPEEKHENYRLYRHYKITCSLNYILDIGTTPLVP